MEAAEPKSIEIEIDGCRVTASAGASIAAVLMTHGIAARSSVTGEPRSALCGMGICMECRATVDGVAHVRTCQTTARNGMKVVTE